MKQHRLALFYFVPVVAWLILIFLASTQLGGPEVTLRFVIRILKLLTPDQAGGLPTEAFSKFNYIIRKLAHLSEYAILVLLTARAIQFGVSHLKWATIIGSLSMCVIYAAGDEFHQSFVPGRTASIYDVIIDCVGAMLALSVMCLWFGVKRIEQNLLMAYKSDASDMNTASR